MNIGKLSEAALDRAVLRNFKNFKNDTVLDIGIGRDYNAYINDASITTVSNGSMLYSRERIGKMALCKAINNIVVSGSNPVGITINLLLPPQTEEKYIKEIMHEICEECEKYKLSILGGHTELTSSVNEPVAMINIMGKSTHGKIFGSDGIKANQEIVMTKSVGIEGTALIAMNKEKELIEKYSESFINQAKNLVDSMCIYKEAVLVMDGLGVSSMHDVSTGGVFSALWEMTSKSKVGLEVDLQRIPISQETVEISEFYNINPYLLCGSGSLLIACERGSDVVKVLNQNNIEAAVIGKTTESKEKVVINEDERRFLEPFRSDELYSVLGK